MDADRYRRVMAEAAENIRRADQVEVEMAERRQRRLEMGDFEAPWVPAPPAEQGSRRPPETDYERSAANWRQVEQLIHRIIDQRLGGLPDAIARVNGIQKAAIIQTLRAEIAAAKSDLEAQIEASPKLTELRRRGAA
jgi:hypothetical protein